MQLIWLFLCFWSSSAPRMVNSYKRTSSPRSPTNSGELFTPAHEENVRFIHDSKPFLSICMWFFFLNILSTIPIIINFSLSSSKPAHLTLRRKAPLFCGWIEKNVSFFPYILHQIFYVISCVPFSIYSVHLIFIYPSMFLFLHVILCEPIYDYVLKPCCFMPCYGHWLGVYPLCLIEHQPPRRGRK